MAVDASVEDARLTLPHGMVPSQEWPTGLDAVQALAAGAHRIQAAVAFVTASGADLVEGIHASQPDVTFEVVARGAPITEPAALVRLAEAGVGVSIVVGERSPLFHPEAVALPSS